MKRMWILYQIEPSDSITDKINRGLDASDIGIICLSNNFLNVSSGWTKAEWNYFIQRRMQDSNKKFIIMNFDVPHDEMPLILLNHCSIACIYSTIKSKNKIRRIDIGTIK